MTEIKTSYPYLHGPVKPSEYNIKYATDTPVWSAQKMETKKLDRYTWRWAKVVLGLQVSLHVSAWDQEFSHLLFLSPLCLSFRNAMRNAYLEGYWIKYGGVTLSVDRWVNFSRYCSTGKFLNWMCNCGKFVVVEYHRWQDTGEVEFSFANAWIWRKSF